MENSSLVSEKLPYTVKTLVAVNSICYCYIELAIDQHCALFGDNNIGKTSLLNALKLHLFPEISFHDCKTKFAFKSNKGELYSNEQSYNWYFPESSSFLILEAENDHGEFCIILSQSNSSLGYQRLVLPCAYKEIRHHFWNIEDTETNGGLGSPVNDLSFVKIQTLYEQYKKSGAIILTKTAEIKEKLFIHDPFNQEKGRYCLVPFKDGGTEKELTSFKQLINFTFEITKANAKILTETFATLIESDKTHSRDHLQQDLQQILNEYLTLKSEQEKLIAIENHRDDFHQLKETYRNLTEKRQIFFNTFYAYEQCLQNKQVSLQNAIVPLQEKCEQLLKQQKKLDSSKNQLGGEIKELSGQIKILNRDVNHYNQKIQRYEKITLEYPKDFTDVYITESLEASKHQREEELENLKNKEIARNSFTAKVSKRNSKIKEKQKKEDLIKNWNNLFIFQLDEHSSNVLNHLNNQFTAIKTLANIEQKEIIKNFSNLFTVNCANLNFLNENFDDKPVQSFQARKQEIQNEIDALAFEIKELDSEIKNLHEITQSSNQSLQNKILETQENLKIIEQNLTIVKSIEEYLSQKEKKSEQVASIKNQREAFENQQNEIAVLLLQYQNEYSATSTKLESFEKDIKTVNMLLQRLPNSRRDDLKDLQLAETIAIDNVSPSDISKLEDLNSGINNSNREVNKKLNEFISKRDYFPLPIEMQCENYPYPTQQLILDELRDIFSELPIKKENLQSRIGEYNKMTGTKISELANNRSYINTFKNMLNHQLAKYHISNLQEVKVEIELDKRFEELINELDHTTLLNDVLYNDALYQRLNIFCADFFTGIHANNRILEVRKIITSVKYSYKIIHQDEREEKDQSTGTNALINFTHHFIR